MYDPTRALENPAQPLTDPALMAAAGYLAGYRGTTRVGYTIDLRNYWTRGSSSTASPLSMYAAPTSSSTSATSKTTATPPQPSAAVSPPSQASTAGAPTKNSSAATPPPTSLTGGRDHALACLLGLNGLRVSEACNADIENLGFERGHHTLLVDRKGGKRALIPLAPRTFRAVTLTIDERDQGPILLGGDSNRLDRFAAYRIVRRLGRKAGIAHKIHPHCLRHAFITAALDAGVPLRDVQEAASHSDPRTTSRYDRHRVSLDRHAAYTVAAFVAGATNGR